MKRLLLFITLLMAIVGQTIAQTPEAFQYQAVIRDSEGNVRANENITVSINLLQGATDGTLVYAEDHDVSTNDNGLVNLAVGRGTPTIIGTTLLGPIYGDFTTIDWSNTPYFIEVSVDGTVMGTTELLSVAYAKYAETSGSTSSNNVPVSMGNISNDATINSGTGNFSVTWDSSNSWYVIELDDYAFHYAGDYVVTVSPGTTSNVSYGISSVSGNILVILYDSNGNKVQENFYFTFYSL
jgi:hypothetical protein